MSETSAQEIMRRKKFVRVMLKSGNQEETLPLVDYEEYGDSLILRLSKDGKIVAIKFHGDVELEPCGQGCYEGDSPLHERVVLLPAGYKLVGWPG
jgi:hypothetical protein